MSNENYEVTEMEETFEPTEVYKGTEEETEKSGSGIGLTALVVGGGLALAGLAAAGIKKLRNKDTDKPKKQKTRLKLVRVPVESDDLEEDGLDDEEEVVDKNVEETEK